MIRFRAFVAATALITCVGSPCSARQVAPTLAIRGMPLADALQVFVERTGESVAFDPALVVGRTVYCVTAALAPEAWLNCLLEGTGLEFFRRGSGTYVIGPRLELGPEFGLIVGRVVDRATGSPLPGAHVLLADAGRGSAADRSGRFAVDRLLPGRYSVIVTHVGFEPWRDSLAVSPGGRTTVQAALGLATVAVSPLVVESSRSEGDPWQTAADDAALDLPRAVDRMAPVATRLSDRAGVTLSDVTSDIRIQGGEAADVSLRLDGVPLLVPRSIASFVGTLGASALDRITISGAGFEASTGGTMGGVIDFRHALDGPGGLDVQVDPYAASGRARLDRPTDRGRLTLFASARHGLGSSMLPASLDRMLRDWSGPDPFLLVAPLRRYDLATPEAIGYATGLFVPAQPSLSFDDVHLAARLRPRPTVSWDASLHVGTRSVGGSRLVAERASDVATDDRPLFSAVDLYDWNTRMGQVRHERVFGSRIFVTAQAWMTRYSLDHGYQLAERIGYRTSQEAFLSPESSVDASRDGNDIDAFGLTGTFSYARGRHSWTGGLEAGRTVSRFDLRLASVSAGTTVDRVVPIGMGPTGSLLVDTTSVFAARHAQISNRAEQILATVFVSDRISAGRVTIEPGLRVTLRPERSTVYAEPRLRAAWSAPLTAIGSLSLAAAGGVYRQYLNQFDISTLNAGAFFPSTRIWLPIDRSLRPPRATHGSFTATLSPSRTWSIVADSWIRAIHHTLAFDYGLDPNLLVDGARLTQDQLLAGGSGVDRGFGLSVSTATRTLTTRVRYERSASWRRSPELFGGRRVPTVGHAPDRISAGLDLAPTPAWDLGLRAQAEFGRTWAFRPVYYDYFGQDEATSTHAGYDFSDPGAHRLPALVTVDATAAWTRSLGRVRLQVRAEVRNLTDRLNELDRRLLWTGAELTPTARPYPGRTTALAIRVVL